VHVPGRIRAWLQSVAAPGSAVVTAAAVLVPASGESAGLKAGSGVLTRDRLLAGRVGELVADRHHPLLTRQLYINRTAALLPFLVKFREPVQRLGFRCSGVHRLEVFRELRPVPFRGVLE
jgi:hypothetical protein